MFRRRTSAVTATGPADRAGWGRGGPQVQRKTGWAATRMHALSAAEVQSIVEAKETPNPRMTTAACRRRGLLSPCKAVEGRESGVRLDLPPKPPLRNKPIR